MTAPSRRPPRHSAPATSDGALASRAADGDSLAFAVLVARHRDLIHGAGARFLPGHERADVEQEAALGLYRACIDFRPAPGVPFRAFADLCVRRAVLTASIVEIGVHMLREGVTRLSFGELLLVAVAVAT